MEDRQCGGITMACAFCHRSSWDDPGYLFTRERQHAQCPGLSFVALPLYRAHLPADGLWSLAADGTVRHTPLLPLAQSGALNALPGLSASAGSGNLTDYPLARAPVATALPIYLAMGMVPASAGRGRISAALAEFPP